MMGDAIREIRGAAEIANWMCDGGSDYARRLVFIYVRYPARLFQALIPTEQQPSVILLELVGFDRDHRDISVLGVRLDFGEQELSRASEKPLRYEWTLRFFANGV